MINKDIQKLKKIIVPVLKRHKVKKAGIFGSYATGEQTEESDVDIVVEYNGSLLDFVGIELELKKKLRKKVDLISYKGIHPMLKKRILSEQVKII